MDKALADLLPDLSRSQLQSLIKEGRVTIHGQPVKASQRVAAGDQIVVRIPPPPSPVAQPEAIPLTIVYEDADLVVIDKPAGMVVHPAHGHAQGTLVNAVLAHVPELTEEWDEEAGHPGLSVRPGIVHRLDRDTSGLIVVAKTESAQRDLQAQFQARAVDKRYLALVDGRLTPRQGIVDAPIGRDPRHRQRMAVIPAGRQAHTRFSVQQYYLQHTLVETMPKTGRTHQIRVHLAFLGFPIVGDRVYGRSRPTLPLDRHFLHAARLTFRLPATGEIVTFESALPAELQRILEILNQQL